MGCVLAQVQGTIASGTRHREINLLEFAGCRSSRQLFGEIECWILGCGRRIKWVPVSAVSVVSFARWRRGAPAAICHR